MAKMMAKGWRNTVWMVLVMLTSLLCAAQSETPKTQKSEQMAGAAANQKSTGESSVVAVQAAPHDVDSADHIIAALYDVISGPKEKERDWNRLRSLFYAGAHLASVGKRPTGEYGTRVITAEEYIERVGPFFRQNGFFENEVARRSESFGEITQAWSTYESRHQLGEAPFTRGINGIQMLNDGKRWWIINVYWEAEREDNKIPEKYLK